MDSKTAKDSAFIFFPCYHYDYEFKKCSSFSNKIYKSFYGDESSDDNCNYYQNLFLDCLKYHRDPINNFSLLLNLSKYEKKVVLSEFVKTNKKLINEDIFLYDSICIIIRNDLIQKVYSET